MPNQLGQGAEGSALIYNYSSSEYSMQHTHVYAIAMDATNDIKGWHIRTPQKNTFYAEPPDKRDQLEKVNNNF